MYWWINIYIAVLTTDSDFNAVSCGGRQSYVEPWWWVEGATVASGTTPLTVPQGITIRIEKTIGEAVIYACFTEVVLAHKWGDTVSISAPSETGTGVGREGEHSIKTSSKAPDVLAGGAMRETNSF